MHPLEKKVLGTICEKKIFSENESAVVCVSGGPDSMALLHLLAGLHSELHLRLVVAHFDHGLRPDEAAGEKKMVQAAAEGLGLAFAFGSGDTRHYAERNGLCLEHAARDLRYGFFREVAKDNGAEKIVAGHTADDQAEEVLLRLLRGSGRKGLGGMEPLSEQGIVRPLLSCTKQELLDYLADRRISFARDSSNRKRDFLRNRIRLDLIPYLARHFNRNVNETLRRTADVLAAEEEVLQDLCDSAWQRLATVTAAADSLPEVRLAAREFVREPVAIQRRLLERVCWQMQNAPSFDKIEQLRALLAGEPGRQQHLSQGLRVRREREALWFHYPQGKISQRGDLSDDAAEALLLPEPGIYPVAGLGMECELQSLPEVPTQEELGKGAAEFLDGAKVSFPLTLRLPAPGDRFHPLGAPGSKKVGDFLTDNKVEAAARSRIRLLCDRQGIVAVLGYRIDERVRVAAETKQVLRLVWRSC